MAEVPRIDVDEAWRRVQAGEARLVCAYDDLAKCRSMELAGSINRDELRAVLPSLPRHQEIIFYCG
ncbi:MAG: rhodanese-like domain-containing protein [Thermoanaerobaculia bacterium]